MNDVFNKSSISTFSIFKPASVAKIAAVNNNIMVIKPECNVIISGITKNFVFYVYVYNLVRNRKKKLAAVNKA